MNGIAVIGLVSFVTCFMGLMAYNLLSPVHYFPPAPPYFYKLGDWKSAPASFAFTFTFSLMFFGLCAPITMAVEGLKFGALFSAGQISYMGLLFIVPQTMAMISATVLGEGIMKDWNGDGSIFSYWAEGMKYLFFGTVLLLGLMAVQAAFPGLGS